MDIMTCTTQLHANPITCIHPSASLLLNHPLCLYQQTIATSPTPPPFRMHAVHHYPSRLVRSFAVVYSILDFGV